MLLAVPCGEQCMLWGSLQSQTGAISVITGQCLKRLDEDEGGYYYILDTTSMAATDTHATVQKQLGGLWHKLDKSAPLSAAYCRLGGATLN